MPSKRLISFQHPLYRENFLCCFITKNNSSFFVFSFLHDSVKYIWLSLCSPLSSGQILAGYFVERDSNYLLALFVFCALCFPLPDHLIWTYGSRGSKSMIVGMHHSRWDAWWLEEQTESSYVEPQVWGWEGTMDVRKAIYFPILSLVAYFP